MSLTFHDMFCGAGGSTLGALQAGAVPSIGMNHWQVACQSYETNHAPHGARAACVDVVTQDPRRYPAADMLLASPECTHHSYARGRPKDDPSLFDPKGDQSAERSRATMWDVVRFAEAHRYRLCIVENVEAAVKWGLPRGRKLAHGAYGPLFMAWLQAMEALDYRWRLVHLNSMVCGVPQSRDRLYVVFWQKGQREPDLNITAVAWCFACERLVDAEQRFKRPGSTTGVYEQQYVYACPQCSKPCALAVRPAAAAIDWTLSAPRICDRSKPLKPATLDRIRRGLERLRHRPVLGHLPNGLVVQVGANTFERLRKDGQVYARAWGVDEAMPTVCGTADRALVMPATHDDASQRTRLPNGEPFPTVTAANRAELALIVNCRGYVDGEIRPSTLADSEPTRAIAASGKHLALVMANREHGVPREVTNPMQTVTTGGGGVSVIVTERKHSTPRDPHAESLDAITSGGLHHALVIANYGSEDGPANKAGWARHPDDEPLGTVKSRDSHALFTYRAGMGAQELQEPVPTVSTRETHALMGEISQEDVERCTFRMLQPHELKLASGFTPDYVLHGNKTEQVCQVGNAVTAPAEAELVRRAIASLEEAA